jgi:hypothetical protein
MMQRIYSLLPYIIFILARSASSQTIVSGDVSGTWTKAGSPYLIVANTRVPPNEVLNVDPGVIIRIALDVKVTINGSMFANGRLGDSILFTSSQAVKSTGQWRGIYFSSISDEDTLKLSYCIVESGGDCDSSAVGQFKRGSLLISNSLIRTNAFGVRIQSSKSRIENCIICDNDFGAILFGARIDVSLIFNNRNTGIVCGKYEYRGQCESNHISRCLIDMNSSGIRAGYNTEIMKCVIQNSKSCGIEISDSAYVDSCIIRRNGNGLYTISNSYAIIKRNIIIDNDIVGISNNSTRYLQIENNTISRNTNGIMGVPAQSNVKILNNIIAYSLNRGVEASAVNIQEFKYNNLYSNRINFVGFDGFYGDTTLGFKNTNGDKTDFHYNMFLNPEFVDMDVDNYSLIQSSKMIDAGDPKSTRDPDSTIADLGAVYYHKSISGYYYEIIWKNEFNEIHLAQNYPNPVSMSGKSGTGITTIKYDIPNRMNVRIDLFDCTGRLVRTLVNGERPRGGNAISFSSTELTPGIYFYQLLAGGVAQEKNMVVIR